MNANIETFIACWFQRTKGRGDGGQQSKKRKLWVTIYIHIWCIVITLPTTFLNYIAI